jgi:membrane carboxypeptidase/penicillin-binding protein
MKFFAALWLIIVVTTVVGIAGHFIIYVTYVSPDLPWGQAFDRVFWFWTPAFFLAGLSVAGMLMAQLRSP